MAKDRTAIVSGAGWIGGFVDLLEREMLAQGWTHDEIHALVTQTHPEDQSIKAIVAGMRKGYPSSALAAEYGYEVVEDVAPTLKSAADLEAVFFLEPGDGGRVNGETMRSRAKVKRANLGLVDLKVAMSDPTKISVEDGVLFIVFAGTLLRSPGGHLYVAYLDRSDDHWIVYFSRVAAAWHGYGRLARCK